jgi:hypothetical protein
MTLSPARPSIAKRSPPRILIGAQASFVVLPSAILFSRATGPEELFGGSSRLYIAAPPTPRGRGARH